MENIFFFVHMNLQNRGVYYYKLCIYIKLTPFLVEKTAEPAFVVVVETYPSFAVALRQIAVVVAAPAVVDSAVVTAKLEEFAAAAAVVLTFNI